VAKKDAVTRREFVALFAVVALAPLALSPDFGWCRSCESFHDLDVPCRQYLEESGYNVIFPDDYSIGGE